MRGTYNQIFNCNYHIAHPCGLCAKSEILTNISPIYHGLGGVIGKYVECNMQSAENQDAPKSLMQINSAAVVAERCQDGLALYAVKQQRCCVCREKWVNSHRFWQSNLMRQDD